MEKFDAVIMIAPYIGEYYDNNVFLRNLTSDEINFLKNEIKVEYRSKNTSYSQAIKDLQYKLKKIKLILEE